MAWGSFAPGASPLLDMAMAMRQPAPMQPGQTPAQSPAFKPGLLNSALGVGGPGDGILNRVWGSLSKPAPYGPGAPLDLNAAAAMPPPMMRPDVAATNGW